MLDSGKKNKPFVIAIANGKGGVGKTTTALAIGTILARRGLEMLLVDLDPQGNLTLSLGLKPHKILPPLESSSEAGFLFGKEPVITGNANLHLIFARSLIVNSENQIQVNTADDLFFLGQELNNLRTLPYDYVVIDCPPSIGKIMSNTIFASDFLIIPSLPEFFSTKAITGMLRQIDAIHQTGKGLLPYRILITLFDRRSPMHKNLKDELRNSYGSTVFETIIDIDLALRQTAITGFPKGKTRGVEQYRRMVDELMDIILE